MATSTALALRYGDEKVPRYTSYPTAPHFHALSAPTYRAWLHRLRATTRLSLYVHIPFCKELCWYCGCATTVTQNRSRLDAYTALLLQEIDLVAAALVEHDAAWSPDKRKYKTPHEFVVSAFRALDYAPDKPQNLFAMLEQLGQPPWRPGSPAGWPDTAEDWGSADALYKRIEWAGAVGDLAGSRAKPLPLARAVLGAGLSPATVKALAGAESGAQGLALLLASPDFLRR